jgi:hypothetical protein
MEDWEKGCHNCGRRKGQPCPYQAALEAFSFELCPHWTPKEEKEK